MVWPPSSAASRTPAEAGVRVRGASQVPKPPDTGPWPSPGYGEWPRRELLFAGYAAIFDRADRGGDVVRRGAFAGAGCVPVLWQHRGPAVGVIERVFEDARGLGVVGRIEDPGLAAMVAAGALTGLSVGYRARAVRHGTYRELIGLDLHEVSLVAQPMQPLARVTAFEWFEEDETA